jgi:AraC-like DNA-binding protein
MAPCEAAVVVVAAIAIGAAAMLAMLLAADAHERRMHAWLIVTLVAVAAMCTGDILEHLHLTTRLRWVSAFTDSAFLAIGPALWLYARALTERDGDIGATRGAWRHFIPAALLFVLLIAAGVGTADAPEPERPSRTLADLLILAPMAAQLGAYLVAIVLRVRRTRRLLRDEYSTLQGRSLSWLLFVAALFGGVLLVWIPSWAASIVVSNLTSNVLIAVALLVIGAFGIRQRNVFARLLEQTKQAGSPPTQPAPAVLVEPEPTVTSGKYARSAIDETTAAALRERLTHVMTAEKAYLENDLTLADLAGRVGATPHQLSQVFSQHLGETFFDFVNRHRVEAVKATLARPGAAGRALLEIALECGFGSKSTFNDTFRKLTGQSPGEFRRRLPGSAAES